MLYGCYVPSFHYNKIWKIVCPVNILAVIFLPSRRILVAAYLHYQTFGNQLSLLSKERLNLVGTWQQTAADVCSTQMLPSNRAVSALFHNHCQYLHKTARTFSRTQPICQAFWSFKHSLCFIYHTWQEGPINHSYGPCLIQAARESRLKQHSLCRSGRNRRKVYENVIIWCMFLPYHPRMEKISKSFLLFFLIFIYFFLNPLPLSEATLNISRSCLTDISPACS